MNSKFFPLVSELLRERYPERYHRIPFLQAWSGLWRNAIASPHRGEPDTSVAAVRPGDAQVQPVAAR